MMTVDSIERLDAHPEESGRTPHAHAALHQPGRRRMAQGVGDDLARELGEPHRRLEGGLHRGDRLPIPFNKMLLDYALGGPATQMGQEPRGDRSWRPPLLRGACTFGEPIENPALKIDERSSFSSVGRRTGDRSRPRSGIEADQYEAGEVSQRIAICRQAAALIWAAVSEL